VLGVGIVIWLASCGAINRGLAAGSLERADEVLVWVAPFGPSGAETTPETDETAVVWSMRCGNDPPTPPRILR